MVGTLAALVLAGCSGGPRSADDWEGTVDTLGNGMVTVSNAGSESWAGEPWRLVQDIRIGEADGAEPDDPKVFGRIRGIEFDENGRVYVLEAFANEVRVFDESGHHVRTIARGGSGPGELKSPAGLFWDPDGDLWVPDPANNRYTVFSRDGAFRRQIRHPTGGITLAWPGMIDSSGSLYERGTRITMDGDPESVLLRMDLNGNLLDTIPLPHSRSAVYRLVSGGLTRMEHAVPFAPRLFYTLDTHGMLWFGITDEYRIYRRNLKGDTLLIVDLDFQAAAVSSEERARALEAPGIQQIIRHGGDVDPDLIPDMKPAFQRFVVADDGTIWVWPILGESDRGLIDVFQADGRYMGRLQGPRDLAERPHPVIRGDRMVAVVQDTLGIAAVVSLRIDR